jgi:hypothetical protein
VGVAAVGWFHERRVEAPASQMRTWSGGRSKASTIHLLKSIRAPETRRRTCCQQDAPRVSRFDVCGVHAAPKNGRFGTTVICKRTMLSWHRKVTAPACLSLETSLSVTSLESGSQSTCDQIHYVKIVFNTVRVAAFHFRHPEHNLSAVGGTCSVCLLRTNSEQPFLRAGNVIKDEESAVTTVK